jgi:hypothetical protein
MISKILRKYEANRDCYYLDIENPYKCPELKNASSDLEMKLLDKWREHIPKGWYGFAIGRPCPDSWFNIIDEFLDYLKIIDPDFTIHQIKTKYGQIRAYLNVKTKDEEEQEFIDLQIEKLEYTLFDEKLIY